MLDITLDEIQQSAVEMAAREPVSLITGGPGTGKTTCLKAIIDALTKRGLDYHLCAPTGKAARRMEEQTQSKAQTIHRLLGYNGITFEDAPDARFILVDESSMIDIHLMSALMCRIDPVMQSVVFMGDADQLPPVGQGCPFRDLIAAYEGRNTLPTIRLQRPYRQDEGSWVAVNAPKILAGEPIDIETHPDFDFYQLEAHEGKHVPGVVVDLVKKLGGPECTQVLTPTKMIKSVGSTIELNRVLQKACNPGKDLSWKLNNETVRINSRVMQTRNNYDIDRFNGEVGKVVRATKHRLTVEYDNGKTEYDYSAARDLQLAYASTIHKSQGSEFPNVVLVIHSGQSRKLLTRQLLYTAVTRAKKNLYIVGDELGLKLARTNVADTRRRTLLTSRLEELVKDA